MPPQDLVWFDHIGPIDSAMPSNAYWGPQYGCLKRCEEVAEQDRRKLSLANQIPRLTSRSC